MELLKIFKTHTARVRASHADQQEEVCALLDLTASQYCWHQYLQYELFAATVCSNLPQYRNKIRLSPTFRGFWNNEWEHRNGVAFLPYAYESKFNKQDMKDEYLFIHSAARLFHDDEFYNRFENILNLL